MKNMHEGGRDAFHSPYNRMGWGGGVSTEKHDAQHATEKNRHAGTWLRWRLSNTYLETARRVFNRVLGVGRRVFEIHDAPHHLNLCSGKKDQAAPTIKAKGEHGKLEAANR